jgi:hypothetical protein
MVQAWYFLKGKEIKMAYVIVFGIGFGLGIVVMAVFASHSYWRGYKDGFRDLMEKEK